MPEKLIMKRLVKTLSEFGLQITTSNDEEKLPYEACIVDFGMDEKERPVALQILHYSQDIISAIQETEEEPNPTNLSILSFVMTIPVEIPLKTIGEVMRLICLANKSLPLGSLNCSEIEKSVYFTYSIPIFNELPSELTLLTILQTALFVKDTFLSTIDEVALGSTSVHKILEDNDLTPQLVESVKHRKKHDASRR